MAQKMCVFVPRKHGASAGRESSPQISELPRSVPVSVAKHRNASSEEAFLCWWLFVTSAMHKTMMLFLNFLSSHLMCPEPVWANDRFEFKSSNGGFSFRKRVRVRTTVSRGVGRLGRGS